MATKITIDPVTRLEGHLKIEVTVDTVNGVQQVVDAQATGTLFRGFETILVNRSPFDALHITQRICGVCPVAHGLAASLTLDNACGVTIPNNARVMRNLVLGANYIQSHILHFYHLSLPDFVDGPAMPPWTPKWSTDKRFDKAVTDKLIGNYVTALVMRRKAHEAGAIFGGKLPHPPTYMAGGFTTVPSTEMIARFRNYLNELLSFILGVYLPDVQTLDFLYTDYNSIGEGPGNLLAYGVFDLDSTGSTKLLRRGLSLNKSSSPQPLDTALITEHIPFSWYDDSTNGLNPASGDTVPVYPKADAYSWLKAPRYQGLAFEVGPLARMWVNSDYRRGVSVMDRHKARANEALKVAQGMLTWLDELTPGQPVYTPPTLPLSGTAVGLTEAPRGALGHWLELQNSRISNYQIVTPTCWNASPRDSYGNPGPIEDALIGTPVQNINEPVEVARVVHSFDPCLSCAVHVMRPKEDVKIFCFGRFNGGSRECTAS